MSQNNGSSAREPFGRVAIRKGFVSEHQVAQGASGEVRSGDAVPDVTAGPR